MSIEKPFHFFFESTLKWDILMLFCSIFRVLRSDLENLGAHIFLRAVEILDAWRSSRFMAQEITL